MRALITNSFKAGVYKIRKGLAAALVAAANYDLYRLAKQLLQGSNKTAPDVVATTPGAANAECSKLVDQR